VQLDRDMGEPLKQPPLVEALCEFRFDLAGTNELTLPGLFYAQVKDEFPIQTSVNEICLPISVDDRPNIPPIATQRLQLRRPDNSATIQMGQSRLIINHLKPYISWNAFRELILKTFKQYINLCSRFTLNQIRLRYINHIPLPSEEIKIDNFLTTLPLFPKPFSREISRFQQTYEFREESSTDSSLVHKTSIATKSNDEVVLILDLDFVSQRIEIGDPPDLSEGLIPWLNQAHDRIEAVFIASLNPSYYESLK